MLVIAGVLALAGLSLLRPSAPTTDPWGWIVWGREVTRLELNTATIISPSWKPLPVLFTTPLALLGGAAPALWLLVARAAALTAIVAAFALGRRISGTVGGAVAAVALALSSGYVRAFEHGYSEPLMTLALLASVWWFLQRRYFAAYVALVVVALGRPEVWLLVALAAVALWRSEAARRWPVVALALLVPLLWLGGDWLGAGDPFHGREVAETVAAHVGVAQVGWEPFAITGIPLSGLALVGWLSRPGDSSAIARLIGGCVVAWTLGVCLLVALGYPAAPRFMALPAALVCVSAGAGVRALVTLPDGWRRLLGRTAAMGLLAAATLLGWPAAQRAIRSSEGRASSQAELRALASHAAVRQSARCGVALPARQMWNAGAVAWQLDLPLPRVQRTLERLGQARRLIFTRLPDGAPPGKEQNAWAASGGCFGRRQLSDTRAHWISAKASALSRGLTVSRSFDGPAP